MTDLHHQSTEVQHQSYSLAGINTYTGVSVIFMDIASTQRCCYRRQANKEPGMRQNPPLTSLALLKDISKTEALEVPVLS